MRIHHFVLLTLVAFSGCRSDWRFGREVEGKVVTPPSSRFGKAGPADTSQTREEKFSIKLQPYKGDSTVRNVAGGPSGLVIECTSTRCAQVEVGTCHRFKCKKEARGSWCDDEPSVIHCKHVKEIECPKT